MKKTILFFLFIVLFIVLIVIYVRSPKLSYSYNPFTKEGIVCKCIGTEISHAELMFKQTGSSLGSDYDKICYGLVIQCKNHL